MYTVLFINYYEEDKNKENNNRWERHKEGEKYKQTFSLKR
jgi:hypothetical protein